MKVDKLLRIARQGVEDKRLTELRKVCDKMTTDQLEELVEGNPTDSRIREIFDSVGGLHLLESG